MAFSYCAQAQTLHSGWAYNHVEIPLCKNFEVKEGMSIYSRWAYFREGTVLIICGMYREMNIPMQCYDWPGKPQKNNYRKNVNDVLTDWSYILLAMTAFLFLWCFPPANPSNFSRFCEYNYIYILGCA